MITGLYRKIAAITFSLSIVFSIFVPVMVFAQTNLFPCNGVQSPNGDQGPSTSSSFNRECTFADLVEVAQAVAAKIVQVGLILAPLIFAYAGWLLLTSADNPGKRTTARKIFINVVVGIVIMMLAWVFVNLIMTALVCGVDGTAGTWFDVKTNCAPNPSTN